MTNFPTVKMFMLTAYGDWLLEDSRTNVDLELDLDFLLDLCTIISER